MNILVLCTGNSCRSQMGEGYLRLFAGEKATVYSAGVEAHGLNPRAVTVMAEDGVDISTHESQIVDDLPVQEFDYVITVCDNAKERCPFFPAKVKMLHHNFPDPAKATGTEDEIMAQFREVRDMVKEYMRAFAEGLYGVTGEG